ncbi:MAG TPA: hypothetical protein VMZ28_11470 [Kofleriaceae bacterium]|nr:hypothetical protein [Kofleriaceae bacterium]
MRILGGMVALLCSLGVAACGGGGGGDDDGPGDHPDGGGGGDPDAGGGAGVTGVAHVVQGATPPPAFALTSGASSDGKWYVSPDQIQVTLTRINFAGTTPENSTGADLTDCVVTYDRGNDTLDPLLDCPFSIPPGTYLGMNLFRADGPATILIDDAINGIYTDPGSPTKLSGTEPDGGAAPVEVSFGLGGGAEQFFAEPLVVEEGDTVSLAVVVDAVQSATIEVSDGGDTLEFNDYFPAYVLPTLGSAGTPQFYTSSGTADSYNDDLVLANILRVYYDANDSPVYSLFQQRAGAFGTCLDGVYGIGAYPADPDEVTPLNDGSRAGGWLGKDDTDTLCWAYAADNTYETYNNYLTMDHVDTVGMTTTVSCEQTADPTPPTSGSTYASGCPAIAADTTVELTLTAQ